MSRVSRKKPGFFLLAAALACVAPPSSAHRLDEYLQATLVAVARDRVELEINLTPGVAIAPQVIAAIDRDRSGVISPEEEVAYANTVMAAITLQVDGRAQQAAVTARRFPTLAEMTEGLGTIRLKAAAHLPAASSGTHEVLYRNMHRPELGVYLANALVPADSAIEISAQRRDVQQHELRIDYRVAGPTNHAWGAIASASVASLLTILVWRRYRAPKFEV